MAEAKKPIWMRAAVLPLAYLLVAGAWVLLSDRFVDALAAGLSLGAWVHSAKGIVFVLVTALLLYLWLRRILAEGQQQQELERMVRERTAELRTLLAEHERTQDSLSHKRVLLRSLLDSIPDLVFFKDRNFVYLGGNPAFAEFVGLSESQFVGQTDFDLFAPEMAKLFRSMDEAMFAEGKPRRNEEWVTYPDGRHRLFEVMKAPFYGPTGELLGLVGISRDITERHEAALALQESENRFRRLVEQTNVVAWELDLATWRFTYVSPHAVKLLGYPVEDWYQEGFWADHIHPDDRDWAVRFCTQSSLRGEDHNFEYRFINAQGETVWLRDLVAVQFDPKGATATLRGVIIDVSESKKSEAELIQTSKLSLLGELAAGVAHELNQPLNIIRLTAESALMDLADDQIDLIGVQERLHRVSEQSERMGKIINHLRILSRRNDEVIEVFELREPVMAAIDLVERQFANHHVRIAVRGSTVQSLPVRGNRNRFEQVVLNLLTNARDAILATAGEEKGGTVTVCWSADDTRQGVRLSVSDTGGGIRHADPAQVFEPFYTTKPAGVGTGLGLSISQSIVAELGGRIEACNRRRGAMFLITVPLCDRSVTPQPEKAQIAPAMPSSVPHHHMLIVDDESAAVATLADFFRRRGFQVSAAPDGDKAWEIVKADPCHLVITDLRMPGSDGLSLIRRLEEHDPTLPVLLVTGELDVAGISRLKPMPVNIRGVFHKPINLPALAACVDSLIEGGQVEHDVAL